MSNHHRNLLKGVIISLVSSVFTQTGYSAEELDLQKQGMQLQTKLDLAVEEYDALTQDVAEQRLKLVTPLNEMRLKVSRLRSQTDMLLLNRSQKLNDVERTEERNTSIAKQIDFVDATVANHLSNFDTLIHAAEDQLYRPRFSTLRAVSKTELTREEQILARLEVIDLSFERIKMALGGYSFEGQAVSEVGDILDGKITLAGPTAYFVEKNKKQGGLLGFETNSLLPLIGSAPEISADKIAKLSDGALVSIPIDITLGQANEFQKTKWSFEDHIKKGGMVGYVIIGFAGIAILIVLVKLFDLARTRGIHSTKITDLIQLRESEGVDIALAAAEKKRYPTNRVLSIALKYADHETNVIEEVIIGEIRTVKTSLERLLPFLAITAATAPLMGLLGTVVGMIKTFSLITVFGSGNAASFSSGISEALITTEFGLVVAIPALIVHGILLRAARERLGSLEDLASEFFISLQESNHKQER